MNTFKHLLHINTKVRGISYQNSNTRELCHTKRCEEPPASIKNNVFLPRLRIQQVRHDQREISEHGKVPGNSFIVINGLFLFLSFLFVLPAIIISEGE